MRRLVPAPLLSFGLFVGWLVLNRTLAPAHLLLAAVLALGLPALAAPLRPRAGPVRRPLRLATLILYVGYEVVKSAIEVMLGVLRSQRRPPNGAFVDVPLTIRDSHALASLAIITTVIPGTVWTELAPDRSTLRLHVFDLGDEREFVERFTRLYVKPLEEIFE